MSATGSILTDRGALEALNSIAETTTGISIATSQLSTGLAVSSPGDNPAPYITAQGMTLEEGGLTQAISNSNQGVSLAQVAEGGLQQQIGIAQKLYAIAVQAANGTETPDQRQALQGVAGQLVSEINSISSTTQFNGRNLLDGTLQNVQFQVGANEGQVENLSIGSTNASNLGTIGSMWTSVVNPNSQWGGSQHPGIFISASANDGNTGESYEYKPGSLTISGGLGSATVTVSKPSLSAYTLAQSINAVSTATGVTAGAVTKVTITLGSAGNGRYTGNLKATQGRGGGSFLPEDSFSSSTAASMVAQINSKTVTNGISAVLGQNGALTLTQANGYNLQFDNESDNFYTSSGTNFRRVANNPLTGVIQFTGQLTLKSPDQFSITNGSYVGLEDYTTHGAKLSSMNLSTQAGAESAMGVISAAMSQLETAAGGVGAFQDGLSDLSSNLSIASTNNSQALGVVQDANIPAETTQLSEAEIQAQSGVAALKNSTALQQAFLSLLP